MPWGAAAAAVGAIGGAYLSNRGARDAAKEQRKGADAATALQRDIFERQLADQMPWLRAGHEGLNALLQLSGLPQIQSNNSNGEYNLPVFGNEVAVPAKPLPGVQAAQPGGGIMQRLMADPGYQFRMQQGQQALDRSASARGGLFSGRAAKDLMAYGQGMGSQEYQNAWNRLANIAGIGQTATSATGQAGQNFANQAGQNIMAGGNARASGYIDQANAIGGGLNQLGQIAGYYYGKRNGYGSNNVGFGNTQL